MTPLIFMGQEWAASSPFQYFTDHEEGLGRLISAGRRQEFAAFAAFGDEAARAEIPDPQAAATFERSRLRWEERALPAHARVLELYRRLLKLRRTDPVLRDARREILTAEDEGGVLVVRLRSLRGQRWLIANLAQSPVPWSALAWLDPGYSILLASSPIDALTLPPWTSAWLGGVPGQSGHDL